MQARPTPSLQRRCKRGDDGDERDYAPGVGLVAIGKRRIRGGLRGLRVRRTDLLTHRLATPSRHRRQNRLTYGEVRKPLILPSESNSAEVGLSLV